MVTRKRTKSQGCFARLFSGVSGQRGATLIEIMIATLLVSIVALGMVEFFARGRTGFHQEERKRVGTQLAQEALERTVAQPYDQIGPWTERRTIATVEYTISVGIQEDAPEPEMKTILSSVTWDLNATNTRTASLATFVYDN